MFHTCHIPIMFREPDLRQHYAPSRATPGSAAYDLRYCPVQRDNDKLALYPHTTVPLGTGISIELPEGFCAMVLPRSGMSAGGITIANSPGLIDSDYRGEIKVLLTNNLERPFLIEAGDRIAQLIFLPIIAPTWEIVDRLSTSERGDGGFGSTGRI